MSRWRNGLALFLLMTAGACRPQATPDGFFAPTVDPGASLSPAGIFPQGRTLAFMGYSGNPARDLTNGFTVAGPVYGNQMPYLERAFSNGWPVVAHIGPSVTFNDKAPDKYKVDEAALRAAVESQVRELAGHPGVTWWAVQPEELRPWRKDEMQYLRIVCETVRRTDPSARPIFIYNPNNRAADSLIPIVREVDILGKGCYVNSVGRKRDRAWVRWSIEQEVAAIQAAGRTNAVPILIPELCRDPDPSEDCEIRDWVRHDVYLGLCSGAKGVLIWSLFRRGEVRRTWTLWYDAYAECARELNGPRALSQVFLFGSRTSRLTVTQAQGPAELTVPLGGDAEAANTTAQERAPRAVAQAAWTSAEYAYGERHWLFIVNSANTNAAFEVTGLPRAAHLRNAFDDSPVARAPGAPLRLTLPAYGVAGLRISGKAD